MSKNIFRKTIFSRCISLNVSGFISYICKHCLFIVCNDSCIWVIIFRSKSWHFLSNIHILSIIYYHFRCMHRCFYLFDWFPTVSIYMMFIVYQLHLNLYLFRYFSNTFLRLWCSFWNLKSCFSCSVYSYSLIL